MFFTADLKEVNVVSAFPPESRLKHDSMSSPRKNFFKNLSIAI
jgi:hypothetical protein